MSLKEYKAKRNFRRTREPAGARAPRPAKEPFFVVQKHDATRLHYDFRLEMNGVLKSWAVPKGFPARRGDRRLAIQVEDHPLDYARFEGIIPEGNYGAGTVMVWDIGSYAVKGGTAAGALESGKLHLTLRGKKLKGDWTLVRMRDREARDKPQWLLLKSGDDLPPLSQRAEDQSVLSKRTLRQIAAERDAEWQSNRAVSRGGSRLTQREAKRPASSRRKSPSSIRSAQTQSDVPEITIDQPRLPRREAAFVEPMKALLVESLPKGTDWTYEVKFDGVRALAVRKQSGVRLISRNGKDLTARFPGVIAGLKRLPSREAVLDGEVVALDPDGRPSFQLLQAQQRHGSGLPPIFYYVFDLIQLDGKDLTGLPLLKRKATAQALVAKLPDAVRFSGNIQAESARVLKEMQARGLEGLIAKRKDSRYEIGRRSGVWVKFKWTNEQEFVIGGYTEPRNTRPYFGAILVGYRERGKWIFASKVGTGFDQQSLKSLHARFQKLVRPDCPFANLPEPAGRSSGGLTAAEMRRCTWLEPTLVCQIRFAEWTRDHHLRQPVFLGLREDKQPREVVRERSR